MCSSFSHAAMFSSFISLHGNVVFEPHRLPLSCHTAQLLHEIRMYSAKRALCMHTTTSGFSRLYRLTCYATFSCSLCAVTVTVVIWYVHGLQFCLLLLPQKCIHIRSSPLNVHIVQQLHASPPQIQIQLHPTEIVKKTARHPLPRAIVQTLNELEPSGPNDNTNVQTTKMSVNKRLALLAECIESNYDIF